MPQKSPRLFLCDTFDVDPLAVRLLRRLQGSEPEAKYSAGYLYYCPEDQTILLTRRSGIMHHPYKWDLSGGRSDEADKNTEETARREALEELGTLPDLATPVTLHRETWKKDGEDYHYYVYLFTITEDQKVLWTPKIHLSEENAGFKWFKLNELPSKEKLHFDLSWVAQAVPLVKTARTRFSYSLEVLSPRFELKYWMPFEKMAAVRDFLRPYVTADEHGLHYGIHNIYYDNDRLESFTEHEAASHFKLRARTYGAGKEIFLEIKQKTNGVTDKARSILPMAVYANLLKSADGAQKIPFLRMAAEHESRPLVRLDYDREAYNAREASGRVTFDTNVRCGRCSTPFFEGIPSRPLLPAGRAILELKFSGEQPDFMGRLLQKFQLQQQSISKYRMGVLKLMQDRQLWVPGVYDYNFGDT